MRKGFLAMFFVLAASVAVAAPDRLESDVIHTSSGDLEITFVGHGSLIFAFGHKVIYVDPYSPLTDYAVLPKADSILITHEHRDHLDINAIDKVRKPSTKILCSASCFSAITDADVIKNGETRMVDGVGIEAVPAYNLVHKRDNGKPFHPKGEGNGYILTFGDTRVYVAGDTENIPEMKALRDIDIAFLPMNLPYTMTPGMVADAALAFRPKILYPYHFGDTDTSQLVDLLKEALDIEVRIRAMN